MCGSGLLPRRRCQALPAARRLRRAARAPTGPAERLPHGLSPRGMRRGAVLPAPAFVSITLFLSTTFAGARSRCRASGAGAVWVRCGAGCPLLPAPPPPPPPRQMFASLTETCNRCWRQLASAARNVYLGNTYRCRR